MHDPDLAETERLRAILAPLLIRGSEADVLLSDEQFQRSLLEVLRDRLFVTFSECGSPNGELVAILTSKYRFLDDGTRLRFYASGTSRFQALLRAAMRLFSDERYRMYLRPS